MGIRKRTVDDEKKEIVSVLGRRANAEMSTWHLDVPLVQDDLDKPVDTKQLKRYLKDQISRPQILEMAPGVQVSFGKRSCSSSNPLCSFQAFLMEPSLRSLRRITSSST